MNKLSVLEQWLQGRIKYKTRIILTQTIEEAINVVTRCADGQRLEVLATGSLKLVSGLDYLLHNTSQNEYQIFGQELASTALTYLGL